MKIIKNAFVYRINLPASAALQDHLAELQHRPILETESGNAGFVLIHGEQVANFTGGIAFAIQYDEKILPASVVREEVKRRAAKIEEQSGYKIGRADREAIKDQVIVDLLKVSHVKSQTIVGFYHQDSRLLFVNTSSKKMAGLFTGKLVRAVGAAKTETINISDVKGGLTTRLALHMAQDGSDPFGQFELEPDVWLKGDSGKITYQIDDLSTGDRGLIEALNAGMRVESVRLGYGPVSFKLTSDFEFKAIRFEEGEPAEHDDAVELWRQEASVQVFSLVRAIEALCTLFDYQAPTEDPAA